MALILLSPPAAMPVGLQDVKDHLRIEHDEEDALLESLIATATARLDGRDGALGRCLITQAWELSLPVFWPEICLPLPPCQSVTEVSYLNTSGDRIALEPDDFVVSGLQSIEGARIEPSRSTGWPATATAPAAVAIAFTAGYGDTPTDVPMPLRTAIMLHVGHLHANRESVMATNFAKVTPHGYEDLILEHRTWSF